MLSNNVSGKILQVGKKQVGKNNMQSAVGISAFDRTKKITHKRAHTHTHTHTHIWPTRRDCNHSIPYIPI